MNSYRIVFKRSPDHMFVEGEIVKAKSGIQAEWILSDKYNISRNLIVSQSLWSKK